VAIFDHTPGRFLGMTVQDIRDHRSVPFDVMVVARLDRPDDLLAELASLGIPEASLVSLRPPASATQKTSEPQTIQAGSGL
jgi:hypothetical protein